MKKIVVLPLLFSCLFFGFPSEAMETGFDESECSAMFPYGSMEYFLQSIDPEWLFSVPQQEVSPEELLRIFDQEHQRYLDSLRPTNPSHLLNVQSSTIRVRVLPPALSIPACSPSSTHNFGPFVVSDETLKSIARHNELYRQSQADAESNGK